jgi:hypothetical protein
VLNVSCPAWGTDQQFAYWMTEGRFYRPDYLVIMISNNDMREMYNKKLCELKDDGDYVLHKANIPLMERIGWYLATKSSVFQFVQKKITGTNYGDFLKVFEYYPVNYGIKDSSDWDAPLYLVDPFFEITQTYVLLDVLTKKIKETCEETETRLLLAKIPSKSEFTGDYEKEGYSPYLVTEKIKELADNNGIPFLNLNKILEDGDEDPLRIFMSWEYHFNKEGHDFVAEQLFFFFKKHKINTKQ